MVPQSTKAPGEMVPQRTILLRVPNHCDTAPFPTKLSSTCTCASSFLQLASSTCTCSRIIYLMQPTFDVLTFLCRIFGQFSMEVILATAFGQKIQILQGEATDLTRAAKTVIDGFSDLKAPMMLAFVLGELCSCSPGWHDTSSYHYTCIHVPLLC